MERARVDVYIFFLLISSAFVLITTNILQEVIEISDPANQPYLPLSAEISSTLIQLSDIKPLINKFVNSYILDQKGIRYVI